MNREPRPLINNNRGATRQKHHGAAPGPDMAPRVSAQRCGIGDVVHTTVYLVNGPFVDGRCWSPSPGYANVSSIHSLGALGPNRGRMNILFAADFYSWWHASRFVIVGAI